MRTAPKSQPCSNPHCKGGRNGAHVQDAKYPLVDGGAPLCVKCYRAAYAAAEAREKNAGYDPSSPEVTK